MSNETARLAREWAERKKAQAKRHMEDAGYFPREDTMAAIEQILATTSPLTMADVEWDDKEHYLSGAVDADGHEVVMLDKLHGNIRVCDVDQMGLGRPVLESPKTITPNGKRYELREVGAQEEPARPATLVTEQDYENAPEGTIVNIDGTVAIRGVYGWICTGEDAIYRTRGMFDQGEGEVIRWGWGK